MKTSSLLVLFAGATAAARMPPAFQDKLNSILTPEAKDEAKSEMYTTVLTEIQAAAMAIPEAAVEDFWEVRNEYSSQPLSTQCQNLQSEFDDLQGHYSFFLTDPLAVVDSAGTKISDNLGLVGQLEEDLETTKDVVVTVKAILTGLTFLPMVGSIMGHAKNL